MRHEKLFHQSPRKSWKYNRPEHGGGIQGMQDPSLERHVRARRFVVEAAKINDLIPRQSPQEQGALVPEAHQSHAAEVVPAQNIAELAEHER